ncbi:hypothetical protein D9613_005577 [Agrocybe pediades]|uniref:F-box domain-containing protein n=1 Tax=Agrocybe pediades TaxID=84607 RepID=A0A8H4QY18_9AGAR|nr:hypothetical protein D9613_005577 [Agrocybe pediades]KAF9563690.1 hypothetical protein CPC08DRAFT_661537 [Agrocybe pediades]
MSLLHLPPELLDNVCHHLAPTDLHALALTAPRFYHAAQRRLYRHLSVDARNLKCVFTLARNPAIARHVRSFAIRIGNLNTLLKAFYRHLATALSNMSELTSLEVTANQAASWVMRTRDDSSYTRLRRFASSFNLDENLAHFLNKADALQELEVDPFHDPPSPVAELRMGALPRLTHFTGSTQAAQCIVPGRPIQHIHLNSGDLTEDVAESLAQSSAPIVVLAAATSSHSVALIKTLTRCMERLVHLRIVTTYHFSDAPDNMYFANIADALTSLPDLQSCEIWGLHWVSSKKSFHDHGRVWESEAFNPSYIPPNNLLTNGTFLDDLYSDFSYAY